MKMKGEASVYGAYPAVRLRRLRQNQALRQLVSDIRIDIDKLVLPLFIRHGSGVKNPIQSMPGHHQWSVDTLSAEISAIAALGIKNVLLFGIPCFKDGEGRSAVLDDGVIQSAIPAIKAVAPHMVVMTDLCYCEYTDHGHCGVLGQNAECDDVHRNSECHGKGAKTVDVDNDATLPLLSAQAVSHAKAGADVIAPSACMDGMVQAIRQGLDSAGFAHLPILSYAVKYASAFYGPFRQAAEGAPQFGDRSTYQMDFANGKDALYECAQDVLEGADMLMVKPAHTYLDVICRVKAQFPHIPLAAYHTSGEFAMLKAASASGLIDERKSVIEVLTAIHRAGADFIATYYAKEVAQWLLPV